MTISSGFQKRLTLGAAFLLTAFSCLSPEAASAQGQATSSGPSAVTVKIGYLNLGMVKANFPQAANSEILKAQAEAQLREEARTLNDALQKLKEEKKPEEEIKKHIEISQTKINAKQQALAQLLQTQENQVRVSIAQAVNAVAKEKGLDIIVDGQSIFAGGQKFLDNGVDVTREVIAKLRPDSSSTK